MFGSFALPRNSGGDRPRKEAEILADHQKPINHTAFDEPAVNAAGHSRPTWFVVSAEDQVLDASAQKLFAGRMKATRTVVEGG